MSHKTFSPEQIAAVRATGSNLLVSAAAGAGKTTVLVERILHLLLNPNHPVDMDRFLVVTFTRSAAAEMKDRVAERIRAELDAAPDSAFLRRQLSFLDQAAIGTIDSFCQEIVRQNFHCLGVNPGFNVLDPDEARLLWNEVCDSIFESHYADNSARGEEFRALVDAFGGRGHDAGLAGQVRNLYDFIVTSPAHQDPLARVAALFGAFDNSAGAPLPPICNTPWGEFVQHSLIIRMESWILRLERAASLCAAIPSDEKLFSFIHHLLDLAKTSRNALSEGNWAAWRNSMPKAEDLLVPRMSPKLPPEQKDLRRAIRSQWIDPAVDDISAVLEFEARYTEDEWRQGIRETQPLTRRLILLSQEIMELFGSEKRRLNSMDFSDLEQLALRALSDPVQPANLSQAARLCRDRFEYVLVDEFQDVNDLQSELLRRVSRQDDEFQRPPNLFAVGDVKQSIYGFRLADPDIFIDYYVKSSPYEFLGSDDPAAAGNAHSQAAWRKIDLPRNYRCRQRIVEAVNVVFQRLMDEHLGAVRYDSSAALQCGRQSAPPGESLGVSPQLFERAPEILLVDKDASIGPIPATSAIAPQESPSVSDSSPALESPPRAQGALDLSDDSDEDSDSGDFMEALEREGLAIAEHLWRLVGKSGDGSDAQLWVHAPDPASPQSTPIHRPVQWGDIVILLRSVKNRIPILMSALRRAGIPATAPAAKSLLETIEARDMLAALSVIDNPCQDIPLAAFMRSPLCGFSDADLARIRLSDQDSDYYCAVAACANSVQPTDLSNRCAALLQRIARWREISCQCSIAELLDEILEETSYRLHALRHPDGPLRAANLDALRDRAAQFDSFARRGLAKFLEFIERLGAAGAEPEGASLLTPGDNAVRILSIHKAKGLEFPVVVLADLAHRFNMMDLNGPVIMDRRLMIGVRRPTRLPNVTLPSLSHEAIRASRRGALLAEEMRVLYVGMTRARDHLIMSASVADAANYLDQFRVDSGGLNGPLPLHDRLHARSPLDWLAPIIANSNAPGAAFNIRVIENIPIELRQAAEIQMDTILDAARNLTSKADFPSSPPGDSEKEALAALDRVLSSQPSETQFQVKAKWSVTEIKRLWEHAFEPEDGAPSPDAAIPNSLAGLEISPAAAPPVKQAASDTDVYALPIRNADLADAPSVSAAGRGTLTHQFFYLLDFSKAADIESLAAQLDGMIASGRLPAHARKHIDLLAAAWFMSSSLGITLRNHPANLRREFPFVSSIDSASIPAPAGQLAVSRHSAPGAPDSPGIISGIRESSDRLLVQGVMDGALVFPDYTILFDYKTDRVFGDAIFARANAYSIQMRLYARALEEIFMRPVSEAWLVFLAPRTLLPVSLE